MTTALKTRPAPRVSRATTPTCPAEVCLREWAMEIRRWREVRKTLDRAVLPDGSFAPMPELDHHIATVRKISDRASRAVAKSAVGAAFQALLLYGASPIGTDNEPKGLSEKQKAPFFEHEAACSRIGLSLFRVLSAGVNDRDLSMFLAGITAGDGLVQTFDAIGLDLMGAL